MVAWQVPGVQDGVESVVLRVGRLMVGEARVEVKSVGGGEERAEKQDGCEEIHWGCGRLDIPVVGGRSRHGR